MPLTDKNRGTNADGGCSEDYCMYCYKNGEFTQEFTMTQMIEFCLQFLDQWDVQEGAKLTPIQAKAQMLQFFPHLKRWKEKDELPLTEKASRLLAQCENVTIVSIDANGYPRPVQMSKLNSKEFHEVWVATSADSVKVTDFKNNNKAGLCYDRYGDGVSLCGTVEIITDDTIRKEMWQEWLVRHFPDGPNDPNYVLLHFVGAEATFWINGEFSHSNV